MLLGSMVLENIRHTFLDEYGEAFSKGTRISSADSDFRFCVDTQLKRLKNKGLSMDISFRPRERDPEGKGQYLCRHLQDEPSWRRVEQFEGVPQRSRGFVFLLQLLRGQPVEVFAERLMVA